MTAGASAVNAPQRILVVTHYFPEHGGGIEIAAQQIAQRLATRGFNITWMASRERLPPTSAPGARPVPAWNVTEQLLGVPYPLWSPLIYPALIENIRRCDVLHLHDSLYMGNVLASHAARRLGKPVLVTQHVGLVPYRNPLLRTTMNLANRHVAARVLANSSMTVFYSRTTQNYFERLLPHGFRAKWISNGIDGSLFHPVALDARIGLRRDLGWPLDRPVFLFVGRFVEKKGVHIIRELARRVPEVVWILTGWGPEDPAEWRLANVRSMGRRAQPEITRLYQAADLLVLPSVGEGFPLVVQESMACGTPVAVSRETADAYPGVTEIAWTADPDVTSFEGLIRSIVAQPADLLVRREQVAAFALAEWNWERCADEYATTVYQLAQR